MATGVRVEGAAQLRRTLRRAAGDLTELKAAHGRAAAIAGGRARQEAPQRSGRMARTVRWGASNTAATIRAGNNTRVRYAGVIHWGWPRHHIAAQPFAAEGAKVTEPIWVSVYEDAVQRILDRVKGI